MFTTSSDSSNRTPVTVSPAAVTSVTYTSPASASPEVTLANTSLTDCSSLTGSMSTPVFFSISAVALPQGTSAAQTTTFVPPLARSWKPEILAGLPGGVAISSVLEAKSCGSVARSPSLSMFLVSAEAKTSAGAPSSIWATRSEEPPKLVVTFTPGWSFSNSSASSVNVSVSEAAAKTVSSCFSAPSLELPHPARASRAVTATTAETLGFVIMGAPLRRWST